MHRLIGTYTALQRASSTIPWSRRGSLFANSSIGRAHIVPTGAIVALEIAPSSPNAPLLPNSNSFLREFSTASEGPLLKENSAPGNPPALPPALPASNPHLVVPNKGRPPPYVPTVLPLRRGLWCGAVLVVVALVLPAFKYENDGALDSQAASVLYPWVSHLRDMAGDVGRGIGAVIDGLVHNLTSFWTNAYHTAITLGILAQCVNAVLFSKSEDYANELTLRLRLIVTSLLADLAGASHARRRALVRAGDGAVADWLLEAVIHGEHGYRLIQAEAARAIAHFLSDAGTCDELLARPNALSHLLLFTASIQPNTKISTEMKLQFDENNEKTRGRSMLVAAMMDIVTASCEHGQKIGIKPRLSGNADVKDITAALRVLQEGGLLLEDNQDGSGGHGDEKGRSLGLGKVLSMGNDIVGALSNKLVCSLTHYLSVWCGHDDQWFMSSGPMLNEARDLIGGGKMMKESINSHGLWDDLQGRYMAVPLAAWAVATWAEASVGNCAKIAEIDEQGVAIMAAVMAPERTVKWHGALAARHLLKNGFKKPAVTWADGLLKTSMQASDADDVHLSLVTLNSFLACVNKSEEAREAVRENNLPLLRSLAKQTFEYLRLQKVIVDVVEILYQDGAKFSSEEAKKWSSILLQWTFNHSLEDTTRASASRVLAHVSDGLGHTGVTLLQAWLAMLNLDVVSAAKANLVKGDAASAKAKTKGIVQSQLNHSATQAANELAKVVWKSMGELREASTISSSSESPWGDFLMLDMFQSLVKGSKKDPKAKAMAADADIATRKALKALTELSAEDPGHRLRVIEAGGLHLLRRLMFTGSLHDGFKKVETSDVTRNVDECGQQVGVEAQHVSSVQASSTVLRHAARLLSILSLHPLALDFLRRDKDWCKFLDDCADGQLLDGSNDLKLRSHARTTLLNVKNYERRCSPDVHDDKSQIVAHGDLVLPRYEDKLFLINTESSYWKSLLDQESSEVELGLANDQAFIHGGNGSVCLEQQEQRNGIEFDMDVVFVHGLCGGPFKTWRIADDKTSTTGKGGLVEKIDVESGKEGTCWPKQWLQSDLPACRLMTLKYKTNFSQWSGATLPLQEVSAVLLDKLLACGVGDRPVVFVTHSMGGLVVKQMLMQAGQDKSRSQIVKNTSGIVFYSCPHFGSKLADMPWRFGLVLRPAPSIGELRSGSTRLEELNQLIRTLHKSGLEVLSFSETKVTPLVEGYGGWALRMEVVPIESAYPGFGELVVLNGTDHVNSCKPLSRDDAAYTQTLLFLQKLAKSAKDKRIPGEKRF